MRPSEQDVDYPRSISASDAEELENLTGLALGGWLTMRRDGTSPISARAWALLDGARKKEAKNS
jgi:hypothetical protein